MNRECGCQHNARNILVTESSKIKELFKDDVPNRDLNVQNILELLAGEDVKELTESVNKLQETIEKLDTKIKAYNESFTEMENKVETLKNNVDLLSNQPTFEYINEADLTEENQIILDDDMYKVYLLYNLEDENEVEGTFLDVFPKIANDNRENGELNATDVQEWLKIIRGISTPVFSESTTGFKTEDEFNKAIENLSMRDIYGILEFLNAHEYQEKNEENWKTFAKSFYRNFTISQIKIGDKTIFKGDD